ncbi:hypothetical protein [Vibrio rotiferianus]|jgi:hypothetical protein|uniref:hypothetical protein n=1 Tax=Vibrio rotiferianus TaxID=190895 RepID=UPI000B59F669|nr:hypothetical protein [Vibrio rotiferianus]ASI97088.1 hypothetical protein BSZ04_19415 [Vibrio rotiferianus]CAH1543393.1 conserved exported hypothetical protein [Vibrio rotiferianus]CAH1583052.1 conserved exported hypothetical protein [Vibrio rotiferianus]CAH1585159.1 conserved exported hypothetical protein [Vibrio rotiferianus]CAH1588074.1 conserved exported hypothetical protein [Vibrio rotiferianus]
MRILTVLFIAMLSIAPITASASGANGNAGKAFGNAVKCTYKSGNVEYIPRQMCSMFGGKYTS